MIKMSLPELEKSLGVAPSSASSVTFHGVSTDTRTLISGNLFVALVGENVDGHDFIAKAEEKGANAILASRPVQSSLPTVIVPDTLAALGQLSANWRDRFQLPLIGVTGSNGKTTLKNMIASILRATSNDPTAVLATIGNLNNQIGLPLTLLRLSEEHRFGVIEMGMNHFGEIDYLTKLTKPMVAIITNAAECHLEGLKDVAGVAKAKGEIFGGLPPNGIAILNHDDPFYEYWRNVIGDHRALTFGLKPGADVTILSSDHQTITMNTPSGNIDVKLPLLGTHNQMNAMAATAATLALGIDIEIIKQGLEQVKAEPGRMRQYFLENELRIIDDSYNANPFSLKAAIQTLASLQGTKIMVLGDMKELGPAEKEYHRAAGEQISAAKIDYLFTLGDLSRETSEAFGDRAKHFTDIVPLLSALKPYLASQVNCLVKGSRSMKMEKIIEAIVPKDQFESIKRK